LVQTVVETAVVWIEANNEAEAEDLALAQVTTGAGAEWKFKDVIDGIEIAFSKSPRRRNHDSARTSNPIMACLGRCTATAAGRTRTAEPFTRKAWRRHCDREA
jgi:hypothetical protein